MTRTLSERHAAANALMAEAGRHALRLFGARDDLNLSAKAPLDFVSEADREVERFFQDALAVAFPGQPLIGEEYGGETSPDCWVVDPIDGTANFLRGSPLWGISLAHMRDGQPDLGVIHYPVLGLTLSAETGSGLWIDGKPARRDARFDAARVVAVGENTRWTPEAMAEIELHLRKARWGVTGYRCASISLGFAALGRTDGYIERYTSLWDLAGGVVICAEAGLTVRWGGEIKPQGLWVIAGTPAVIDAIAPIQTSITD